jgi:hypothetical protein
VNSTLATRAKPGQSSAEDDARARAMAAHPAGKGRRQPVGLAKLIAVPLVLMLIAALQISGSAPASAATAVGGNLWAGVIDAGTGISSVSGRVTVPKVDAACATNSNAAVWVGLGGYGTVPFAQNGITVTPGGFGAWYELFDKFGQGPVVSVSLPMKAGDVIGLGLAFSANHTMLTFTWSNLTSNQTVTRTITGAARWYNGTTAEWIVERGGYDPLHDTPNLAHFSPITFTNAVYASSTVAHNAMPNTYTSTVASKYIGGTSHPMARVTSSANAQAFTTTWVACH